MTSNMASKVHCTGQACDMCGVGYDTDRQRSRTPSKSLRSNAQSIDPLQDLCLHRRIKGIGIFFVYRTEPLRRRPTYIIKDVRLFLNSVERGVRLMQSAGVGAEVGRCDTDEEILLTIHIPKRRPAGVVTDS